MDEHFIEVELREVRVGGDWSSAYPILLVEKEGKRAVQIFIGFTEVAVLDGVLAGQIPARPLTHDLIFNVLDGLGAQLLRVLVVKLEANTFFGALEIQRPDGEIVRVDARPSDSVILAMKRNIPIFVEKQVFDATGETVESIAEGEFPQTPSSFQPNDEGEFFADEEPEDDEEEEEDDE